MKWNVSDQPKLYKKLLNDLKQYESQIKRKRKLVKTN